jgi:integrase
MSVTVACPIIPSMKPKMYSKSLLSVIRILSDTKASLPNSKLKLLLGCLLPSEHVPITAVSKILGHANPAITMSIYAHELKEDFEQVRVAMAKFA